MPDRDMPDLGRERLIAEACRGARIPRERREARNPRYLLGCRPVGARVLRLRSTSRPVLTIRRYYLGHYQI